jgi:hypothetical protein
LSLRSERRSALPVRAQERVRAQAPVQVQVQAPEQARAMVKVMARVLVPVLESAQSRHCYRHHCQPHSVRHRHCRKRPGR